LAKTKITKEMDESIIYNIAKHSPWFKPWAIIRIAINPTVSTV
jgi:hypothetical protein